MYDVDLQQDLGPLGISNRRIVKNETICRRMEIKLDFILGTERQPL